MKKIILLFLFALTMQGMGWAAEYPMIGNISITEANKNGVTGPGITGKITYDSENRILTLENATIEGGFYEAIHIWYNTTKTKYTILLKGTNKAIGKQNGISLGRNNDVTFTGTGTLEVTCGRDCFYFGSGAEVTFTGGCTIKASNTNEECYGMSGDGDNDMNGKRVPITVDYANLQIKGKAGVMNNIDTLIVKQAKITSPADAKFVKRKGTVCVGNTPIGDEWLTIAAEKWYPIWVGGVQITEHNLNDVTGDGTVAYNLSTQTLTLNNASIRRYKKEKGVFDDGINGYGIKVEQEKLFIKLIGKNTIGSTATIAYNAIYQNMVEYGSPDNGGKIHFYGPGSLNINSSYIGIEAARIVLEDYCSISVNKRVQFRNDITISSNSSLEAEKGVVSETQSYNLQPHSIFSYGKTKAEAKEGTLAELLPMLKSTYKDYVLIRPRELWVGNVKVTSANAADVLAGTTNEGKVKYDEAAATLYLTDVSITRTTKDVLEEGDTVAAVIKTEKDINIILSGENSIRPSTSLSDGYGIYSNPLRGNSISISGSGSLNIKQKGNDAVYAQNITIKNATITSGGGIRAVNKITIADDASVQILTEGGEAIVTQLENYEFYSGGVLKAGADYASAQRYEPAALITEIIENVPPAFFSIRPKALWVGGVKVTSANAANVLAGTENDGKVVYDEAKNKLTLKDAVIREYLKFGPASNPQETSSIVTDKDLEIVLIGVNQLYPRAFTNSVYGIYSDLDSPENEGNISISGKGSLTIKHKGAEAIKARSIKIDSCTLVSGKIKTKGQLSISGDAIVEITAPEDKALYSEQGNILIYEGADIFAGADKYSAENITAENLLADMKPYVNIKPISTGIESLDMQEMTIRGGKGEIHIAVRYSGMLHRQMTKPLVSVYDLSGSLVRDIALPLAESQEGIQVSIPAGIYIVKIGSAAEKVVVR